MANTKQAKKRVRQNRERRERNRRTRGQMRGMMRKVRQAIEEGDAERVQELLPKAISRIDKTAKKGIIHRNTASRYKSQLETRARELQEQAG